MSMDILQKIAAAKRREVEAMKVVMPEGLLREMTRDAEREVLSMKDSILSHNPGIIAEHKRRSPSRGEIAPMSEVGEVAKSYLANGAAAMSVLTDTPYFGGSLTDLAVARSAAPSLPILRKEFMVDAYQVYQTRLIGADAILLIAAMIGRKEIAELNDLAHSLGLQTLVEIHSVEELKSVPADAEMVGVNNRDLTSFTTDISNSSTLIDRLPSGIVKIAESGIRNPDDVTRLKECGFDGFLIGEAFMSAPDPGRTLRKFVTLDN